MKVKVNLILQLTIKALKRRRNEKSQRKISQSQIKKTKLKRNKLKNQNPKIKINKIMTMTRIKINNNKILKLLNNNNKI